MSEVKVVKFISGQEVLTKVLNDGKEGILIESPLTIQVVRTQDGGLGVSLVPFSFGGKVDQVVIDKRGVLCVLDADEQIATQYLAGLAGLTVEPASALPKISLT